MPTRPFRFGVTAGHVPTVDVLTRVAQDAENLGFDTFLTPDPASGHDPMAVLGAVAAVTTTLHFGTFVLAVPYREAKLVAWQAKTLHALSGGRFELGLGAGRPGGEGQAEVLGRPYGTPAERFAMLESTVDTVKEAVPDLPLMLAGAGRKMLELAARTADIVTLTWGPKTTIDEADAIVDRFRTAAGDHDIELNLNLISVGDEPAPWMEKYIGVTTAELAEMGAVTVLPGGPDENATTLSRLRDRWGVSYVTVNADYMRQFAPVIERLRP